MSFTNYIEKENNMNIISFEEFEKMFAEQGFEISQSQYDMLDKYAHILVEYNKVMNLTGITDPMGISEKHFLDSLLISSTAIFLRTAG